MSESFVWIEGIPFSPLFSSEVVRQVRDEFVVRDEDVLLVVYPKSGTNWLIDIISLIQSKGNPTSVQSLPTLERIPLLELEQCYRELGNQEGPRLIFSHLQVQLFPKSFFSSKAKVIYLFRDPRDVLVSGFHFWPSINYCIKPESLEGYFEDFIQGKVPRGSWFEHVRGWMSLRDRDNVLMLSYEELKRDPRSTIKKICEFLEKTLEPEELELVLKNISFQVMKKRKMAFHSLVFHEKVEFILMRKGIIGDWKNHLTVAQAEVFNKVFQEKMADFPKELFPWE